MAPHARILPASFTMGHVWILATQRDASLVKASTRNPETSLRRGDRVTDRASTSRNSGRLPVLRRSEVSQQLVVQGQLRPIPPSPAMSAIPPIATVDPPTRSRRRQRASRRKTGSHFFWTRFSRASARSHVEAQYCPCGSSPSMVRPNMLPLESQFRLMWEPAA